MVYCFYAKLHIMRQRSTKNQVDSSRYKTLVFNGIDNLLGRLDFMTRFFLINIFSLLLYLSK